MNAALAQLRRALYEAQTPLVALKAAAEHVIAEHFADRVIISDARGAAPVIFETGAPGRNGERTQPIFDLKNGKLHFDQQSFSSAVLISNSATSRVYSSLEYALRENRIRSFAAIPLLRGDRICGVLEVHFCNLYQRWQRSDIARLEHIADLCSAALDRLSLHQHAPAAENLQNNPATPASHTLADAPLIDTLPSQDRRIRALYELARSLTIDLDPAIVALRGLRSLLRATSSTSGVCVFFDQHHEKLEIVAAEGLSARYIEKLSDSLNVKSLLRLAVARRESFRVPDLQSDTRAASVLAKDEGLRACVVVPLAFEDIVYGALAIFHRDEKQFSQDDLELIGAAANQICLIARQAEYYASERRNSQSLSALYQLTHELSKHFSAKELAEHAFPIIQDQFPCKRMWLATLNDERTHLVGQAGFGPGLRRRIVNVQIQRSQPHEFLDQALEQRKPVIVPKGQKMECSGIRMIVRRLELGTLVILPLVSLGQSVGVLILEPEAVSPQFAENNLSLLTRMAGEIATVMLARRFESRMASDDKMRTAGLLASGVAHNFNNLLQAIMGQSSLIEMQLPKDSPLVKSAQLIVDSSHRGAGLIKQLVACTVGETQNIEPVDLAKMIDESRDFYRSILGSQIELKITIEPSLPTVMVDYGRMQQTIANILVQAKDAIGPRTDGKVELTVASQRIAEVDSTTELLPGTYAAIRIRDNGAGLDKEQQVRIFEPFFALYNEDPKNHIGGVGHVNLSAAYALIRNYGGTITLDSVPQVGSEFSILVPEASARENSRRDRRERDEMRAPAQGPAVLLLDIEDSVTSSVVSLVESMGYRARALRKRQKVREAMDSAHNKPLVLMIDTDRSSEDIVGFVREMAATHPDLRILISTFDPKRWTRLLKEINRIEIIAKPVSIWALDKLLRNLVLAQDTAPLDNRVERLQTSSNNKKGTKGAGKPLPRTVYEEQ